MLIKRMQRKRNKQRPGKRAKRSINRLVENDLIRRVSFDKYQDKVRSVYGGRKGALLSTCSALSLHMPLGEKLLRRRRFDLRGCKRILDVGSGAGQIAGHLVKYADDDARIVCSDLSSRMLDRARARLKDDSLTFVAADVTQLPFGDASFDCVTCGYTLEHLPDPRPGLAEISRVLAPGGRMLLLTTEDNFGGAWTSRLWYCRTYNRRELRTICEAQGLIWKNELWFTRVHKMFRAGGICVAIEKVADGSSSV